MLDILLHAVAWDKEATSLPEWWESEPEQKVVHGSGLGGGGGGVWVWGGVCVLWLKEINRVTLPS